MTWATTIKASGLVPQNVDVRHVEGYMRASGLLLGEMSARKFNSEIRLAVACIDEGGTEAAERLARSYGL